MRDRLGIAAELDRQASMERSLAKGQALSLEADRLRADPHEVKPARLTLRLFRN